MSQPSTTPVRPPHVTVAAWLIMVGSVFVVLMVWDRIAGLHTLDSQRALHSVLDDPGVRGTGLTVNDLMLAVKIVSMVGAGCATAMVILGYQALQRSRGARVGLTVLAAPLFVCGLVTGGFVSSGVAAAVATLWLGPSRIWFQGGAPRPADTAPGAAGPPTTPPRTPPQASPGAPAGPRPSAPLRTPLTWTPPPTSAYDLRRRDAPTARPPAVLGACLVTWVSTALAALVLVGSLAVLALDSGAVLDKMHEQNPQLAEQGIGDHTMLVAGYVTCGVLLAWSLATVVFAVALFRRRRWGWYATTVSASATAVLCLVGVLGSVVLLVPCAAAVTTIALLVRPQVRSWLLDR